MEASSTDPSSSSPPSPRDSIRFPPLRYFHSPLSSLLEYSGLVRSISDDPEAQPIISDTNSNNNNDEVAIRIMGAEEDLEAVGGGGGEGEGSNANNANSNNDNDNDNSNGSASSYQRYDIQQVARWIEQILPFSLLLLLVFIRQHLQGFFR